ncbi:hypothetical protein JCM10212_002474 [Sporobolomyces blumeae]
MAIAGSSPLLAPSPNASTWGCQAPPAPTIRDLLQERNKHSPVPPPSPALSDSGFSTFVDSPATVHSPLFNYAQHQHFDDEAVTPEVPDAGPFDEPRPPSFLAIETDLDRPPRVGSPPLLASPSTNTETFSDCSPSPSIASVRMAKLAPVPHRRIARPPEASRLSVASSALSGSIEAHNEADDDDDDDDDERFKDPEPQEQPPEQSARSVTKSDSQPSQLSRESWKDDLDDAVKHLESDPNLKPDDDAMQRMRSILGQSGFRARHDHSPHALLLPGLKMKIISQAPWDSDADDDDKPLAPAFAPSRILPSRKSSDMLSQAATSITAHPPPPPSGNSGVKDRKENVKPGKSRARSFSVLTSRRTNTTDSAKERNNALHGLGLGLGQVAAMPDSPSKRSFKGLVKSNSGLPASDSSQNLPGRSQSPLQASIRHNLTSGPSSATPVVKIISERKRVDPVQIKRTGASSPPVKFDLVAPSTTELARPIPKSAPPTVSTFARSDSHASLLGRHAPSLPSASPHAPFVTSPQATPKAEYNGPPTPTSPEDSRGSYFTAVPGGTTASPNSPFSFGHHLISLEEARQREASRPRTIGTQDSSTSLSSQLRTRESTLDSVGHRKGTTPPAAQTHVAPAAAALVAPLPPPKALKPKKSGFLKRMMGGGDKTDLPEMPHAPVPALQSLRSVSDEFRSGIASSVSNPSLTTVSAPSTLSRATAKNAASPSMGSGALPTGPAPSSTRVAFGTMPVADPSQRIQRGLAPSLHLRPVSMAFSAGLPSDFLATLAAAEANPRVAGGTPSQTAVTPTEPVVSPNAPSFASVTSTSVPSIFDESAPSGSTLPVTPLTPNFPLSPNLPLVDTVDAKYAALQREFAHAKSSWKTIQFELELQIRSLQIELAKTKEEKAESEAQVEPAEGNRCPKCASHKPSASASVIQRPRFKGQAGTGTLFGSGNGLAA